MTVQNSYFLLQTIVIPVGEIWETYLYKFKQGILPQTVPYGAARRIFYRIPL